MSKVERGHMLLAILGVIGAIAALMTLFGCASRPAIPGYHWNGSSLYDKNGVEVASVLVAPLNLGSSQACIFNTSRLTDQYLGCTYWETQQQAYAHIVKAFEGERPK